MTFRVWAISELLGQTRHPQNAIARDQWRSNVHTWIQVPRASFGATVNVAWDSEQRLPQRRSACLLLGDSTSDEPGGVLVSVDRGGRDVPDQP